MKTKKGVVIVIMIVLGVSITGIHLHNNNKYLYKINIIEQNIKDEKFSDAKSNMKKGELKQEDLKKLNDEIKKQKKIIIVKKNIESSFRYLYGLKTDSDKNSKKALIYAFNGYMETTSYKNIEKCKTLGISEYLTSQENIYLSYLKNFGIDKSETIRICKLKRYERQDIIANNKVVQKQIEANVEADNEIRKANSAEAFE